MNIEPISGFPEYLPADCLAEHDLIDVIKEQYELFGFSPIETPAVERMEVLTAKGNMTRQIYRLARAAEDDAPTDVGLHFDLTVPLARYVVQHSQDLAFPFRRYQIQKVWRGERAQEDRFKEFYQCDIDVVGRNVLDPIHDAEFPAIIYGVFSALRVPSPVIHISDLRIWDSVASHCDWSPTARHAVMAELDRLNSADGDHAAVALQDLGVDANAVDLARMLVACTTISEAGSALDAHGVPTVSLQLLEMTINLAVQLGCPKHAIQPDFSITRGLDYYTGTVYETFIAAKQRSDKKKPLSVCSGGRYDDLAGYFGKQKYPGVGVSIGLSRLFAFLKRERIIDSTASSPSFVIVTMQNREKYLHDYLSIAQSLREAGIATEVFLESKGLKDQLSYASKQGIRFAIIAGDTEFSKHVVQVKDLVSGQPTEVTRTEVARHLLGYMSTASLRHIRNPSLGMLS